MNTLKADFYQGLPIELWNNLVDEVEELFSEQEIGTHILSIYPAGNRIYGIESQSQSLLCLYFDSIDSIIDPIQNKKVHYFTINNQNSFVCFIEFREWCRWFLQDVYGSNKKLIRSREQDSLFHLITSLGDNIYEDSSLNNIIYYAQEIIKNPYSEESYYFAKPTTNYNKIYDLLSARTRIIMQSKNIFIPNINKEWEEVYTFNCSIEDKFIDMVINNESYSEIISEYNKYLNKMLLGIKNPIIKFENKDLSKLEIDKSELRNEVIKLIRSLS